MAAYSRLALAALFGMLLTASALAASGVNAQRVHHAPAAILTKIDPQLRTALRARPRPRELTVVIRTAGKPGQRELQALRRAGVEVRTVHGDLVSARVAARCLERLAALPFVIYVERPKPLAPQRELRP